ncbi:hypothetical protein VM1G_02056 [Cytospora mali]|uniref:Uncharacterized protein n=1 Tax=Cytospora mali TaxID=578113 RepID=A0A194VPZ8_CYTMA|nr:hypothetical protein VM1G_02056 [Valsa mali]
MYRTNGRVYPIALVSGKSDKMATQMSRRKTRSSGQPQPSLLPAEPAANPQAPNNTAVGDTIDTLAQKLDSVGLQDHPPDKPGQQTPTSGKSSRSKSKPPTEPSNNIRPPATTTTTTTITTAQKQPQPAEPLIVRRSRRGEKAISTDPLAGQYRVELTSSERRWCGKFALGISTEAQLGVRMTVGEFDEIFAGGEGVAFNERNRWANDSNFYDEQLDFVLRVWGLRRGLGRLQLGVVRDFEGAFVNSCVSDGIPWEKDNDGGGAGEGGGVKPGECRTVWIHNDNAMLLGRPYNHYSGMVILQKPS